MIACSLALLRFNASGLDGLSRKLDGKKRRYAIHLEQNKGGVETSSDYTISLAPKKPQKDDKPGGYIVLLTDLIWKFGDTSKRMAKFGGGPITMGDRLIPSGVVTPGFELAPLLSFYVPGTDETPSAIIPVLIGDLGSDVSLKGAARLELLSVEGQAIDLEGELTSPKNAPLQFTSKAWIDPLSGWPISASASIKGESLTVVYTLKLKS